MGTVILFVIFVVALGVWSLLYFTFASHYFLVTVIDSGSGNDEIHYPSESIIDWWWKPIFCLWVLVFWFFTGSILLSPLAFLPNAYLICLGLLVWFMYPLSIISTLFTSNWLFFLHPILFWRMLKHYGAFAYVHLITLISASICVWFVLMALTQSFIWALPAAFMVPTAIFFYARHWGRFAWLSINFKPRKHDGRSLYVDTTKDPKDDIPEMAVQEVDEGIRAGMPPASPSPHGIQTGTPGSPDGIAAGPAPAPAAPEEEDEWAVDKKPYGIVGEEMPAYEEPLPEPVAVPAMSASAVVEEEEDEWATDKKPYGCVDEPAPAPAQSPANTPVIVSQYYDERHAREKAAKKKAEFEAGEHFMPTPSKKTPTFSTALFFGVWGFMVYRNTLHVWANLVVLTIVELLLMMLVARTIPNLP